MNVTINVIKYIMILNDYKNIYINIKKNYNNDVRYYTKFYNVKRQKVITRYNFINRKKVLKTRLNFFYKVKILYKIKIKIFQLD